MQETNDTLDERLRCIRDICPVCAGRWLGFHMYVEDPDEAGHFFHSPVDRPDEYDPDTDNYPCKATVIWERGQRNRGL